MKWGAFELELAANPRLGTFTLASFTDATASCFCSSWAMLIVIMETPLPMATPVPTRPVRARMDMETYTDCVLGILRFLSSSRSFTAAHRARDPK
ncbi:hypothetical protein BE221DRAFT_207634 [Ostreococcus tauri]|uniref:Uncharacterized protein n=1 Tax=Ostreococcus tauri TaxID=70448 RepID=A0A1Y5I2C3_OSTTA|nr:hypothetical protein BE221DRAFT_207634 [Ostreococcus tauri]